MRKRMTMESTRMILVPMKILMMSFHHLLHLLSPSKVPRQRLPHVTQAGDVDSPQASEAMVQLILMLVLMLVLVALQKRDGLGKSRVVMVSVTPQTSALALLSMPLATPMLLCIRRVSFRCLFPPTLSLQQQQQQ